MCVCVCVCVCVCSAGGERQGLVHSTDNRTHLRAQGKNSETLCHCRTEKSSQRYMVQEVPLVAKFAISFCSTHTHTHTHSHIHTHTHTHTQSLARLRSLAVISSLLLRFRTILNFRHKNINFYCNNFVCVCVCRSCSQISYWINIFCARCSAVCLKSCLKYEELPKYTDHLLLYFCGTKILLRLLSYMCTYMSWPHTTRVCVHKERWNEWQEDIQYRRKSQ